MHSKSNIFPNSRSARGPTYRRASSTIIEAVARYRALSDEKSVEPEFDLASGHVIIAIPSKVFEKDEERQ
jgi:hypothetical protein